MKVSPTLRMVIDLNKAGVPLMIGTDLMLPDVISDYSAHEKMAIWQEAGILPVDIFCTAIIVPIKFMSLDDRLGSISEGKSASMVLVRGNP